MRFIEIYCDELGLWIFWATWLELSWTSVWSFVDKYWSIYTMVSYIHVSDYCQGESSISVSIGSCMYKVSLGVKSFQKFSLNRTMDECRMWRCQQEVPRNTGTEKTASPVPFTTPQLCTHRPGMKCVQANSCLFRAANHPCMNGCPSEKCHNRGPTQDPTSPRITTNVGQTIEEDQ